MVIQMKHAEKFKLNLNYRMCIRLTYLRSRKLKTHSYFTSCQTHEKFTLYFNFLTQDHNRNIAKLMVIKVK